MTFQTNSTSKILEEVSKEKYILFKSFFPESKYNLNLKKFKKFKKFNTIIVIGMGGSILATKSIYYFLRHKIKSSKSLAL